MSFPALKDAQDKLDAKRKELFDIFAEAGPDRDMAKVKSLTGDSGDKVAEIRKRNEELNELKARIEDLKVVDAAFEASRGADDDSGTKESGSDEGRETKGGHVNLTFAKAFIKSNAFKGYRPGSGVGPVDRLDVNLKTLFETAAGWAPESVRSGVVTLYPTRPAPHVVNFIPQLTTKQAAYKYMEETTFTNNAAEAAAGAQYGEGALALTERSRSVEKVAVFLPVTDEQFEDEAEAEDYVNQRLGFMVQQRLDSQCMVGDGSTPNILGTESVSGIQTQALSTDPIPDAIYKLFTSIRSDGFAEPSVVFIRPTKWQTVRLMRTADGIYIWGSPSEAGPDRIWGVPVTQTMAVTATKAVAGDYTTHSALVVRRGIDIQVSNSHSDFFIKGKLAVRADIRCAMVHFRPKAFGTVTGL